MSMTILITRNAPGRFRGFLASTMHEVAPGVYADPIMKKGVRERIWAVMLEWQSELPTDAGVIMFWPSRDEPGGMALASIGWPKKELVDHEGFWLAWSPLTAQDELDDLPSEDSLEHVE
jgi:CRISPR-associated protein Cas2